MVDLVMHLPFQSHYQNRIGSKVWNQQTTTKGYYLQFVHHLPSTVVKNMQSSLLIFLKESQFHTSAS